MNVLHASIMIRNPYIKAGAERKRRDRPWEVASGSAKEAVAEKSTATSSFSADYDDGGIDWDAAARVVDAAVLQAESKRTSRVAVSMTDPLKATEGTEPSASSRRNPYCSQKLPSHNIASSCSSPSANTISSRGDSNPVGPRVDTMMTSSRAANLFRSHLTNDTTRPPMHPSHSQSVFSESAMARENSAIELLRPVNWKKRPPSSTSSPSSTTSGINRFNDPRQESLPVVLQFDPTTVRPVRDEYRTLLVKHAELAVPLLNGWKLFSHQKEAILRGILMRRCILALDMGLGKTLIGCVWAKAFCKTMPDDCTVIVICPVSLKKEWKRTAEQATGLVVADDKVRHPDEENQVWITSWAKIPTRINHSQKYVVVADEAHSMQSMQAARTRDALQLMQDKRCIGVLLLTGTPMKNGKPSNLFPLLKAVHHPFGCHQRAYETHFCQGREAYFGQGRARWTANGSSNLKQLRELVQSHLLHLTKEDCLSQLPPQTRVTQTVPVSSRRQLQHNQALQHLSTVFASSRQQVENGNEAVLGAVQKLRIVGSLAKIDGTVQLAKKVLNDEPAVVIFTSFVAVAKAVHQQLVESGWTGELLTGDTPANKRQGMVDNFQNGLSPVFVCTFGAGGVGLTLTAAHTVILLDRPWTPGEAHQAEDRVRRIGQTKPVKSIWMSAFELDQQIDKLLQQKSQTANTVLSTTSSNNVHAAAPPKLSIFQLLQKVLPTYSGASSGGGLTQTSMVDFTQEMPS